jgi:hypothetical protein
VATVADGLAVARSGEVDWDRLAELAIAWRMQEQGPRLAELRAEDPLAVPAAAVERALQAPRGPGDRVERMSDAQASTRDGSACTGGVTAACDGWSPKAGGSCPTG